MDVDATSLGFFATWPAKNPSKPNESVLPTTTHKHQMSQSMPPPRPPRPLRGLQPAPARLTNFATPPPRAPAEADHPTSFLDLPPEIRIEIYTLVLKNVTVHIIPSSATDNRCPHALLRTCHQIRAEVAPLIHNLCPIQATITNFDFSSLLNWIARIPCDEQKELVKNTGLSIRLCTTLNVPGDLPTLRRWLHDRADHCRPQPQWRYSGPIPSSKVASDLRRRVKRMKEPGKRAELVRMIKAIGVSLYDLGSDDDDSNQ